MIAHLILFRPKASLSNADREALIAALETAFANIPSIARAHVGRRVRLGRLYDQLNAQDFPFAAMLEFASETDLRAYLDHPAHNALGEHFYRSSEAALAFDFELVDPTRIRELVATR